MKVRIHINPTGDTIDTEYTEALIEAINAANLENNQPYDGGGYLPIETGDTEGPYAVSPSATHRVVQPDEAIRSIDLTWRGQ